MVSRFFVFPRCLDWPKRVADDGVGNFVCHSHAYKLLIVVSCRRPEEIKFNRIDKYLQGITVRDYRKRYSGRVEKVETEKSARIRKIFSFFYFL